MARKVVDLEEIMKIKCYIMCYYPPDLHLVDQVKDEIRNELLKDFLDTKVITQQVYDRLVRH